MKKIEINQKKCLGCETCTFLAPTSFKIGMNGKAEFVDSSTGSADAIKSAMNSCPGRAISYVKEK